MVIYNKVRVMMMSALLLGTGLTGFAQEPDKNKEERERLNREMTLERDYDPIVQDATKVMTLPAVREISVSKRPITYSDYALPVLPAKEMNLLPPGKVTTELLHSKRDGYLHFGGGTLANLTGDFGYHFLNTETDLLGVYFSHRSTNGNVAFDNDSIGKRKAKINDNLGGLDFKHHFDKATLTLGGNFGYSMFNYYGFPTNVYLSNVWAPSLENLPGDSITNQKNRLINVYGGISSDIPASLGYHIGAAYTNFHQKYSLSKEHDGMTENHLKMDFGLRSPVNNGNCFGVNVEGNLLTYTAPDTVAGNAIDSAGTAFKPHVNVTLNPYYRLDNGRLKLLLGLNLVLVSQNSEQKVFVSPNISLDAPFANWSVFYAKLGGGVTSNSMAELSRTNRYLNPAFTPDASKTWADLTLGVRSSATAGFWFDIFAGYKYTQSDVLFNPSSFNRIKDGFNNVSLVYQPTTQRMQVGATLKYDFQHIVDFYLKGVYNYYMLELEQEDTWKNAYAARGVDKDSLQAYGKPAFVAEAGINVRPLKPLTLSLDYGMMSGIYAYHPGLSTPYLEIQGNIKMKTIHDLRFRSSWKFNDMFAIYAQFNNVLFRKQELYYGYPLLPFSAMAGFSVTF